MSDNIPNLPSVTMNSVDLAEATPESIEKLFSEVFGLDPSLPDWASGYAEGNWVPSAQLCTIDGRKTGNGVLMWWTILNGMPAAVVATDAGNVIYPSLAELEQMFYPPQLLMSEPLYAHIAGIMSAGVEIPDEYMFLFESEFVGLLDGNDFIEDQVYIPSNIDESFSNSEFGITITDIDGETITATCETAEQLNELMAQMGLPIRI